MTLCPISGPQPYCLLSEDLHHGLTTERTKGLQRNTNQHKVAYKKDSRLIRLLNNKIVDEKSRSAIRSLKYVEKPKITMELEIPFAVRQICGLDLFITQRVERSPRPIRAFFCLPSKINVNFFKENNFDENHRNPSTHYDIITDQN